MMKHKKTKKNLKNLDAIERKISAIVKNIYSLKGLQNSPTKTFKTSKKHFQ